MDRLKGKVALITGGTSGIGLATAKLFQSEGADLVVTGRDIKGVHSTQAQLGNNALVLPSDARSVMDIEALMSSVKERFGRLDILFLNAGIAKALPVEQVSEQDFDETMAVNVKGVYFTIQKALPLLGERASVVVTTSISNQIGTPNFSVYGASKAALRSLVRSMSVALIGRGIRINAVSPGPVETPMNDRFGLPPEVLQARRQEIERKSPVKRFATADEIAKAVLFLASDESSYMVGEEIVVDGGISLV